MSQRSSILFDASPVVGREYNLSDLNGQEPRRAKLIKLVDRVDDFGTLPSGGRATQLNRYAIFECCDNGRRFKRVVVPELESLMEVSFR